MERQGTFAQLLEPRPTAGPAADIGLALPIPEPLRYAVPAALAGQIQPGVRVRVPVGSREATGFVLSLCRHEGEPLREISAVLESRPCLTPTTLALGLWVARYYGASPGEALQAVVPAAVRHGRQGRTESLVEVVDPAGARALLEEHQASPGWDGRCRVLRALLAPTTDDGAVPEEAAAGLRLREVLRTAAVSISPVQTLVRNRVLRLCRVPPAPDPFARLQPRREAPRRLTPEQRAALDALGPRLETRTFSAALLHGVTGSGKTEVYLRLLARTLELGRGAILLVPEISLTPQTVERILGRVPAVAVLHSNLSEGDRARQWERLRSGEVRVAVGPRSAVFAPIPDVGLIILDEEHETTFKQQQVPRYHARDAALERGRLEPALVVFGTATPSLETEGLARSGAITRLSLPRRVEGRPLPRIDVVDMRHQKALGPGGMFSPPLVAAMERALGAGEQVLLFLNRRGFSTTVLCRGCGWKAQCRQCAIQLTHYLRSERLLCHYCGHEQPPPKACPECLYPDVRYSGFGTERVAQVAAGFFPGRRVARMDGETLRARGAPEKLFRALRDGEIDVLVGTQVLAKGFDIPGITLVGVVSADTALLIPDFRSAERTFQLLCQVAGRTGRGSIPGRVLIQTYCPDHYSIRAAAHHDHAAFADEELRHRKDLGYPPSGHLLRVVVHAPDPESAAREARRIADDARTWEPVASGVVSLAGPAPCPIPVLKGQHRSHLLFRAAEAEAITALLGRLPRKSGRRLRVLVDRDPVALM